MTNFKQKFLIYVLIGISFFNLFNIVLMEKNRPPITIKEVLKAQENCSTFGGLVALKTFTVLTLGNIELRAYCKNGQTVSMNKDL